MGPNNLRVRSFNKYLPSVGYILGLQLVTESTVTSKIGTVPICRSPRDCCTYIIIRQIDSLSLFHDRIIVIGSIYVILALYNSMQY